MTHQSEEVVLDRRLVHLELEAAAVGDFFVKLREFGVVVGFGRSASKLDYPGKKCGFIFKLFLLNFFFMKGCFNLLLLSLGLLNLLLDSG